MSKTDLRGPADVPPHPRRHRSAPDHRVHRPGRRAQHPGTHRPGHRQRHQATAAATVGDHRHQRRHGDLPARNPSSRNEKSSPASASPNRGTRPWHLLERGRSRTSKDARNSSPTCSTTTPHESRYKRRAERQGSPTPKAAQKLFGNARFEVVRCGEPVETDPEAGRRRHRPTAQPATRARECTAVRKL